MPARRLFIIFALVAPMALTACTGFDWAFATFGVLTGPSRPSSRAVAPVKTAATPAQPPSDQPATGQPSDPAAVPAKDDSAPAGR